MFLVCVFCLVECFVGRLVFGYDCFFWVGVDWLLFFCGLTLGLLVLVLFVWVGLFGLIVVVVCVICVYTVILFCLMDLDF